MQIWSAEIKELETLPEELDKYRLIAGDM